MPVPTPTAIHGSTKSDPRTSGRSACRSSPDASSRRRMPPSRRASRASTTLSAAFALLATVLAAVGLYGVLAYTVAQRTREIGLRMALGAAPGRVRAMVLRQVAVMTLIGGAIGLVGAMWMGYAGRAMLFR